MQKGVSSKSKGVSKQPSGVSYEQPENSLIDNGSLEIQQIFTYKSSIAGKSIHIIFKNGVFQEAALFGDEVGERVKWKLNKEIADKIEMIEKVVQRQEPILK